MGENVQSLLYANVEEAKESLKKENCDTRGVLRLQLQEIAGSKFTLQQGV